ncbi:MAG: hypothetical protein JWN30_389 [Bacilli bacterium]|nr:hypothetical protein [Bacilli bacterium]
MYLFSYFKTQDESMYLASSRDGFSWEELNGGAPVLKGEVGTKQIRDPFVYQDPLGRFHAIWTDGWGSSSIGYAYSDNLLDWQGQRLLPVMAEVAGTANCWAPELFFDKRRQQYRIIWSSTVLAVGEEKKRDHRIWSALTNDFTELQPSSLFFDPGYNVIDACVVDASDRYFMVYKDERGTNEPGSSFKAIRSCFLEQSGDDRPSFSEPSELLTPVFSEGPTLYSVGSGLQQRWLMLYDKFRERRYAALSSKDLLHWEEPTEQLKLPAGVRHGSVIQIESN